MARTGPLSEGPIDAAPKDLDVAGAGTVAQGQSVAAAQSSNAAGRDQTFDQRELNLRLIINNNPSSSEAPGEGPALADDSTIAEMQEHQRRLACFIGGYASLRKVGTGWDILRRDRQGSEPKVSDVADGLAVIDQTLSNEWANLANQGVSEAQKFLEELGHASYLIKLIDRFKNPTPELVDELGNLLEAILSHVTPVEEACFEGMTDEIGAMDECMNKLSRLPKSVNTPAVVVNDTEAPGSLEGTSQSQGATNIAVGGPLPDTKEAVGDG
jgi:hypothetical protein